MKNLLTCICFFLAIDLAGQTGRVSPHDTVSTSHITVTYGRPYKNGRVIFGGLEKYGKVWRLGADEATTISFDQDITFGGTPVKAGTYTMFALLNEKEWTIILNSVLGQWGAFSYEENKDKNVARINVPVILLSSPVQQLIIRFENQNTMIAEWDNVQVQIPYSF
jgi:hypothetical protein